jgi:hypothetical protein
MTDIPEMDTAQLLDLLGTTASRLESDDLPGLAKMHGWALALAQADGPVQAQATTLSAQLEALILGAVDDAETALAEVRAAVAELTGECDDSDPTPTDESSAEPNAIAQPPQSADTESAGPHRTAPPGASAPRCVRSGRPIFLNWLNCTRNARPSPKNRRGRTIRTARSVQSGRGCTREHHPRYGG